MFWEIELSRPNIKKFLYFLRKKEFIIFLEMDLFKITSYISVANFLKKFLIF